MMTKHVRPIFLLLLSIAILAGCRHTEKKNTLFTQLPSSESGIHFSNDIHDNDSSYSFINEFGYMGGGVGIGDFNNDGKKDIFFSGNQVSSRLYINKGNNRFDDITEKAGVGTDAWATGVSIVDINNDGYDDIYLCIFGKNLISRAKNLLFINQRNLTFKEEAASYGLADTSYSTQAAFFDYDKDGDLDMYLLNYLLTRNNSNTIVPRNTMGTSPANDRLYRNDGYSAQAGHPVFTDVSMAANIKEDGYGLGLAISDYNNDGWPDIYVANDFLSNDELWLNNQNGSFTNCIARAIRHQSYSSMGTDAADINNDGLTDVVTLDMLPENNKRKKTSFFFMNYERYQAERYMGYEPEFPRNMLQLNNGVYRAGDTSIPFFSEIGQLAGIAATDWSWSVLLADFDNDGWKDAHITNGIGRDFINGDFLEFSNQVFTGSQTREEQERAIRNKLASLEHVNLRNYLYINNRDLTFADVSQSAGIDELSMSNGAAYADLDNDGDLDLVVNNIDKEAFVFINSSIQKDKPVTQHYLAVNLKGDSLNNHGFGAKLALYGCGNVQTQEQYPVRGYFSSVDQQLHFGLDSCLQPDSLIVIWPDNKKQVIFKPAIDTALEISWENANSISSEKAIQPATLFSDITGNSGIIYRHRDNPFNDFAIQRLLQQKYSQLGPFITSGDINNDGLEDLFIGNGINFQGQFFIQNKNGGFQSKYITDSIKMEEDMDCLFLDADNDGDQDLIVTSGDTQYGENSVYLKPRLYLNDGAGNFSLQSNAIPDDVKTVAGCVVAADYDGDGDSDLFIGGRVSSKYPLPARSFILQNQRGVFIDVTNKTCPALVQPGMVTSAVWTDVDNDKHIDLVIAGEWMPVRFFKNNGSTLSEVTNSTGLEQMNGMWRKVIAADIDNDGDQDLVAGNLGLNCLYRVSTEEPMKLLAKDIDGNGTIDPVFFYYIKDDEGKRHLYPAISRAQFAEQVPGIKKQFLHYDDYARADADDIFKSKDGLLELVCDETRTCILENLGSGKFRKRLLPQEAQFAPVNAIICEDIDGDGRKDLLLAGNEYQADVMTGRYDALYGCLLKNMRGLDFKVIPNTTHGLMIDGDVKDLSVLPVREGKKYIIAAINNDSLRVFRINNQINK
jgi:enediyne biosynthesis protein E4